MMLFHYFEEDYEHDKENRHIVGVSGDFELNAVGNKVQLTTYDREICVEYSCFEDADNALARMIDGMNEGNSIICFPTRDAMVGLRIKQI